MKRLYGISIRNDGDMVCASVGHFRRKGWRLAKVKRWNGGSNIRNFMLLDKKINLGLQSRWIRNRPAESDNLIISCNEPSFWACTDSTDYGHFTTVLRNNIDAVFPDDALLLTLPVHFVDDVRHSFISLFKDISVIKIGIVHKLTLIAVFNVKVNTHKQLEGQIGRIERYLNTVVPEIPPLEIRYIINEIDFYEYDAAETVRIRCGTDDPYVLKAMGCALCGLKGNIPKLGGPTSESRFRVIRAFAFRTALFVSLLSLLSAASLFTYNFYLENKVKEVKKSYADILANHKEIRDLIAQGERLSVKIMQLNRHVSRKTVWGPFFQSIGSLRPSGLYFEKLGSEPIAGSVPKTRIALAGWCENETIATSFIKLLKEKPFLSEVNLASIERINPSQPACRFKIVCVLSTPEN